MMNASDSGTATSDIALRRSDSKASSSRHERSPSNGSVQPLPEGCSLGPLVVINAQGRPELYEPDSSPFAGGTGPSRQISRQISRAISRRLGVQVEEERRDPVHVIWVDFVASSPENPFFFSNRRKRAIVGVAVFFTAITAYTTSAYSIGIPSMCRDIGCTDLQAVAGIGLYAFGFGIAPLVLAPLSEEYGRKWTYVIAVAVFTILHFMMTFAKNIETVLVNRFLLGCAGSIGATLVGGTISDIYMPEDRGLPMAVFAFFAMLGTGLGPVMMAWVEANPRLEWRWIQWIELIMMGAYFPFVFLALKETRATVILRRKAAALRKDRGERDGGRYTARSEIEKIKFSIALRQSLLRPLTFLVVEPVVIFFSIWISVGWGVLYIQIGGLPYIFKQIYGFDVTETGLTYLTLCIGSFIAFLGNFIQDAVYRRKAAKRGVEARLYAPMVSGVTLFLSCFLYGFTSISTVHWIVPCIGLTIINASILTIYITAFVYLAQCYGSYASSAIAGQSFARNMVGGAFTFFTQEMIRNLTPRWAIFLMGCIAMLLAAVPFIAFFYGPEIRKRSPYSRRLMEEEQRRIVGGQKGGREAGGDGEEEEVVQRVHDGKDAEDVDESRAKDRQAGQGGDAPDDKVPLEMTDIQGQSTPRTWESHTV